MTKNKFVHPPYLDEYKVEDLVKLKEVLQVLSETCCYFTTPQGSIHEVERLISNPSSVRKCDLYYVQRLVKAANKLKPMLKEIES